MKLNLQLIYNLFERNEYLERSYIRCKVSGTRLNDRYVVQVQQLY